MDIPTILIGIVGVALFAWTVRSLVKHIKELKNNKNSDSNEAVSEQILNNILFYIWLLFMFSFSVGMIINN